MGPNVAGRGLTFVSRRAWLESIRLEVKNKGAAVRVLRPDGAKVHEVLAWAHGTGIFAKAEGNKVIFARISKIVKVD